MSNLKIKDLSVGDWIKVGGEPARVIQLGIAGRNKAKGLSGQLYGFLTSSKIEPIPITPKILEKNGFENNSECCWRNSAIQCSCLRYGSKYWDMRINGRNRAYCPTCITIDNILHIHELQNALRLAGLDEDIEL